MSRFSFQTTLPKMKCMKLQTLKYSLIVFIGGASYGIMATTLKFAYNEGFNWTQTVASQGIFGTFLFGVTLLIMMLFGKKPEKMNIKQVLKLVGTGCVGCTTSILYGYSLTMLPVAMALTLLFQFTWIGVVIQVIVTKRRPHMAELIAAVVILGGTLFASGLAPSGYYEDINPWGILFASLSSISCALFMFLSSKVETNMAPIQRGFFICCGSAFLGLCLCPDYFTSGILIEGIWRFGLILGVFGLFFPVIMFGIGTPHLPTGISTIMASSELPAGILISVLLLRENISIFQIMGILVILCGVVISQVPYIKLARNLNKHTQRKK